MLRQLLCILVKVETVDSHQGVTMNRIAVFFLVLLRQNGRSLRKRFNGVRFSYIHISPAAILSFCPSGGIWRERASKYFMLHQPQRQRRRRGCW